MFLSAGIGLALAVVSPAKEGALPAALAEFASGQVEVGEVAGLLVEVGGKEGVRARAAAGFADVEKEIEMTPDRVFWIASMSKPITGTAVMMAQEKGLLQVSDPVAKYLPEFRELKGADGKPASVTIAQCLSHTSGLQDLNGEENAATKDLAELTALVAQKPLKFEPGTKWAYCQTGINTAARVLEVVSGQSFPDFLEAQLFQPLGMVDTSFYLNAAQAERLAVSYQTTETGFHPVKPYILFGKEATDHARYPSGAGGLFSTLGDYGKFARMILNGGELDGKRYLTPESIALMTGSHTGELKAGFVPGSKYGLGWIRVAEAVGVTAPLSVGSYGHGGAYGTQAWIDPVAGRYTIMMLQRTNFGNGDASETRALFQKAAAR